MRARPSSHHATQTITDYFTPLQTGEANSVLLNDSISVLSLRPAAVSLVPSTAGSLDVEVYNASQNSGGLGRKDTSSKPGWLHREPVQKKHRSEPVGIQSVDLCVAMAND